MAQLAADIRGVLIPVTEARVLLPNASVSEVITYGTPQPIDGMPEWVFGAITWRGWRIPLFSFSLLSGEAAEENFSGAKVAIIKALTGEGEMPFMALLAQGFPRLTAVTQENLLLDGEQDALPPGVIHRVNINDEPAFVPDLDRIEGRLLEIVGMREAGPGSLLSVGEMARHADPEAAEEDGTGLEASAALTDAVEHEATAEDAPADDALSMAAEEEVDPMAPDDVEALDELIAEVEERLGEDDPLAGLDMDDDEPTFSLDDEPGDLSISLDDDEEPKQDEAANDGFDLDLDLDFDLGLDDED